MSSGMNARGLEGRCFGFFADMKECIAEVRQTKNVDGRAHRLCAQSREDYFECLHGNKEKARMQQVYEEEMRAKSGGGGH